MTLINKEKLILEAEKIIDGNGSFKAWAILSAINEAEEVERPAAASWIRLREDADIYACTSCGYSHYGRPGILGHNYCPHCGSKMT